MQTKASANNDNASEKSQSLPTVVSTELGAFLVHLAIDNDGHLTFIVRGKDGSKVVETENEVGCTDNEIGYRFTTEKIEADYLSAN